jgi:glucose uptake protein GlcU
MILTAWNTTQGPLILVPCSALIVIAAVYLRTERVQRFVRRFGMTLGAFMFANILFYLFIAIFIAKTLLIIPIWGHAWRLGIILAIGSALSAAVAQLTATNEARAS